MCARVEFKWRGNGVSVYVVYVYRSNDSFVLLFFYCELVHHEKFDDLNIFALLASAHIFRSLFVLHGEAFYYFLQINGRLSLMRSYIPFVHFCIVFQLILYSTHFT